METICVAGKNEIAVNALKYLLKHYPRHPICFVPNSTDTGVHAWQPSLIKAANDLGIRRVDLAEIYGDQGLFFFSLEFNQIIQRNRFASEKLYNIHFSMLPKYKGMFTSYHPIVNGESESGVTLHLIDDGIDTGDIVDQRPFEIAVSDTARDLYVKYLARGFELFTDNVERIIKGDIACRKQPGRNSTYYSKKSVDYSSIRVDFYKTAFEIHNQFRALTFREFQMPKFRDWQIIKTYLTDEKSTQKPGTLLEETDEYFLVSSIDYNVKLLKDHYPVLWEACDRGDLEAVRRVLPFIDNLDLRDKNGRNALTIAASHGWAELVEGLLENGADEKALATADQRS